MTRCICLVMLLGCSMTLGCGSATRQLDFGGEDGKMIADLIDDLSDFKGDDAAIAQRCAANTRPPTSAELMRYEYSIVGKPSIDGESATCKIRIDQPDGSPVGDKDWRFRKMGGVWKIEAAPL